MKLLAKLSKNILKNTSKKGQSMADIKLYKTEEVQEILQVTRRTLYRYIKAEQIKPIKLGREYRFTEEEVKSFIERGTDEHYLQKLQKKEED